MTATAVCCPRCASKVFAFSLFLRHITISLLLEDDSHPLEHPSLWMIVREVERLQRAILKARFLHLDFYLFMCAIRFADRLAWDGITSGNFNTPVGSWLRYIFWHATCQEGTIFAFEVSGGVIVHKDMLIVWVMLIKYIHCVADLIKNLLVGEVAVSIFPRFEETAGRFCTIRWAEPPKVGRYKICDHKRCALTLGVRFSRHIFMVPAFFPSIMCIEHWLVMKPDYNAWPIRQTWKHLQDFFIPRRHSSCKALPCRQEDVLPIEHNIFLLMSIRILAFWCGFISISKLVEIAASSAFAYFLLNPIFNFNFDSVKELHQFECGDVVP